ncbi:MAG: hypothetical protein M0Z40_15885 [Actinomycetota bacterium]|nr:hypothetical protein [Actinomycetota bacterium]MDA8076674.1 hypothetical protein [Actinomycetota bacterium]
MPPVPPDPRTIQLRRSRPRPQAAVAALADLLTLYADVPEEEAA